MSINRRVEHVAFTMAAATVLSYAKMLIGGVMLCSTKASNSDRLALEQPVYRQDLKVCCGE